MDNQVDIHSKNGQNLLGFIPDDDGDLITYEETNDVIGFIHGFKGEKSVVVNIGGVGGLFRTILISDILRVVE
jgi:hypothetical protein